MTDFSSKEKAITIYTTIYIKLNNRDNTKQARSFFSLWSLNKISRIAVVSRVKINSNRNNNIVDSTKTKNNNNKIIIIARTVVITIIILLLLIIVVTNNYFGSDPRLCKI